MITVEHEQHHEDLLDGAFEQLKMIFEGSEQAIYLYLDDSHKTCNEKFSSLLGYDSTDEWDDVEESFVDTFVDPKSSSVLVEAYRKAMDKMSASKIRVTWKKKSGERIDTDVIIVPFAFEGHLFGLHFVY